MNTEKRRARAKRKAKALLNGTYKPAVLGRLGLLKAKARAKQKRIEAERRAKLPLHTVLK